MRASGFRQPRRFRPLFDHLEERQVLSTTLVSVTGGGIGGSSYIGDVSDDGRYVVFESYAENLVLNDGNGKRDVFLRDVQLGTTTLVSTRSDGLLSANHDSFEPLISPDGRYVIYSSQATNIVAGITDGNSDADIFTYDRVLGSNQLVSVAFGGGVTGDGRSEPTDVTDDGQRIVFVSEAENLVGGSVTDANDNWDTFVRDLNTNTTTLVSVQFGNAVSGTGNSGFGSVPRISADGRYVVFESSSHNLISDPKQGGLEDNFGALDLFRRDLQTNITTLISVNGANDDGAFGHSRNPQITPDARYIAFESDASDLVANDTNGIIPDVFVRDLVTNKNYLVSRSLTGGSGNQGASGFAGAGEGLSISKDGRYVAFESRSSDLVANDTNGTTRDVFVRDLVTNTTALISANTSGGSGNDDALNPRLSPAGRWVIFRSRASNLISGVVDDNDMDDIFVRDLFTGVTSLVSVNLAGTHSGGFYSNHAILSGNGRYAVFESAASDLVANDLNTGVDVFIRPTGIPTGELQFNAASVNVSEDGGSVIVTVERVNGQSGPVGVSYQTNAGTAVPGVDYSTVSGFLSFANGVASQTIVIPILNDIYVEPDDKFTITLSNPTGDATLGATTTITVTITNEDVPAVVVTPVSGLYVSEAGNTAQFTVFLTSVPTNDVTIALTSSHPAEGTTAPQVTLTPANALTGQVVTVTGLNDNVADGNVPFTIQTGAAASTDPDYDGQTVGDVTLINLGVFATKTTTFQDQDGDTVTIKLAGAGNFGLERIDPDLDGKGPVSRILVGGTSVSNSVLTITVTKAATGNGFVDVGAIEGTGLKALTAKKTDLVGSGVNLSDALLSLAIHDILGGADVIAGGTASQLTTFKAKLIGDGTLIDLDTSLNEFVAERVGDGAIDVPKIVTLTVTGNASRSLVGDFLSDVRISGTGKSLGTVTIAGAVDGAAIVLANGKVGTFQAARFHNSSLFAGFIPTNAAEPLLGGTFTPGTKIGTFTVTAGSTGFVNSTIGADVIGTVTIKSAVTNNAGRKFGVVGNTSIAKVKITAPLFNYLTWGSSTQSSGDFTVKLF